MVVLSEDSANRPMTPSARENRAATEAAKLLGFQVYYIPEDFSVCETAENALTYVPKQERETAGIWIGFIPEPARYETIYDAALAKRIKLLNTPVEHLIAQEFDRSYPKLQGLTPESAVVTSEDECELAVERLGLPVFVKGAVQSRKQRGWKACVAETTEELRVLTRALLVLQSRSRGRVIVRRLARLRYVQSSPQGFPFGREYRVFLFGDRILSLGYYWEGGDPLMKLSASEEQTVRSLAVEASRRLKVPFIAVDIGQLESGDWIVIEVGDGQFSGYSRIPVLEIWNAIRSIDRCA